MVDTFTGALIAIFSEPVSTYSGAKYLHNKIQDHHLRASIAKVERSLNKIEDRTAQALKSKELTELSLPNPELRKLLTVLDSMIKHRFRILNHKKIMLKGNDIDDRSAEIFDTTYYFQKFKGAIKGINSSLEILDKKLFKQTNILDSKLDSRQNNRLHEIFNDFDSNLRMADWLIDIIFEHHRE